MHGMGPYTYIEVEKPMDLLTPTPQSGHIRICVYTDILARRAACMASGLTFAGEFMHPLPQKVETARQAVLSV